MHELDTDAWDRWVSYRKAIRKPIKPASEQAAQLKLRQYGEHQSAVVDQSISNGYQGLWGLKVAKPAPGERPAKTSAQQAKDDADFAAANDRSERYWNTRIEDALGKLHLCSALLARYTVDRDRIDYADRMQWLKERAASLIRSIDNSEVAKLLGDPDLRGMVLQLWAMPGIRRLEARCATPNAGTTITAAS